MNKSLSFSSNHINLCQPPPLPPPQVVVKSSDSSGGGGGGVNLHMVKGVIRGVKGMGAVVNVIDNHTYRPTVRCPIVDYFV